MSRLEVPLTSGGCGPPATLSCMRNSLGDQDRPRQLGTVPFLVDPGTEMTTMPAREAKKQDLPIPKRPVSGLNFQGLEVRSGLLRAQIPGWTRPNMCSLVTFSVIRTPHRCAPGTSSA